MLEEFFLEYKNIDFQGHCTEEYKEVSKEIYKLRRKSFEKICSVRLFVRL